MLILWGDFNIPGQHPGECTCLTHETNDASGIGMRWYINVHLILLNATI